MRINLALALCLALTLTWSAWAQPSEKNQRAAELLSQQRYADCLPLFRELVETEGPRLDLLLGLSESLSGTGALPEALELSERLLKLYPQNAESYAERAELLLLGIYPMCP